MRKRRKTSIILLILVFEQYVLKDGNRVIMFHTEMDVETSKVNERGVKSTKEWECHCTLSYILLGPASPLFLDTYLGTEYILSNVLAQSHVIDRSPVSIVNESQPW